MTSHLNTFWFVPLILRLLDPSGSVEQLSQSPSTQTAATHFGFRPYLEVAILLLT